MALDMTALHIISDRIVEEIERAHRKHGDESMVAPQHAPGTRLAILGEEFGEVCTALTYDRGSREELVKELVQVAAMAASWLYALEMETSDRAAAGDVMEPADARVEMARLRQEQQRVVEELRQAGYVVRAAGEGK